jgi:signal recognition particle GTPase
LASGRRGAEGLLIAGVYGPGKSTVAAGIAYLLEQQGKPYALLDLDYLGWPAATAWPDPGCGRTWRLWQ